jgi:hypothetical protein
MSINHPGTLDPEVLIETWLTDVRREYLPNDIFDQLSSEYINPTADAPSEMPNAIYYKLKSEVDEGRTCKVSLIKDLSGTPTLGANGDQRLHEEDIVMKFFQMQYTDLSHATTNQQYGIYARDKFPWKIFEQRVPLLTRYFKQYFGKMRRQALLELQSENLEDAPHWNTAGISPNWFVPNRPFSGQAVFSGNMSDWTDRVVATMLAAGTGTPAACSLNFLIKLEEWARTVKLITPIDFGGHDGYILTLPTPQISWLMNVMQDGNVGREWVQAAALNKDIVEQYPNIIAKFRGLYICDDVRYPTLTLGGAKSAHGGKSFTSDLATDYTITCKYRGMGNADDGSSDPRDHSSSAHQVGFLIGQAALMEWMPEGFHWEYDYEQYDKFFGTGIFCSVGIKQPVMTNHDNTTDDIQQNSSIVIPFAAPPETTYYATQNT